MFEIGAIRLVEIRAAHARPVLTVMAGSSDPASGTIGLAEARQLVASGGAVWVGEPPPGLAVSK